MSNSQIVVIASDIHFDMHHELGWRSFVEWHKAVKPSQTILLGDIVDLGMMSTYLQKSDAEVHAIPQIKCMVREVNELAKRSAVTIMAGNHDERWEKVIFGAAPAALKGAIGLSLKEQCYAQGLSKRVQWVSEGTSYAGIRVGQFLLRHGHKQGGRFGGGKHLAANRIAKSLGTSEVFGHHHRAQMFAQTADGKTAIAIANPCLTGDHDYAPGADWQRGFTILELDAPTFTRATPHVIIMDDGCFSWGGKTYGGGK